MSASAGAWWNVPPELQAWGPLPRRPASDPDPTEHRGGHYCRTRRERRALETGADPSSTGVTGLPTQAARSWERCAKGLVSSTRRNLSADWIRVLRNRCVRRWLVFCKFPVRYSNKNPAGSAGLNVPTMRASLPDFLQMPINKGPGCAEAHGAGYRPASRTPVPGSH